MKKIMILSIILLFHLIPSYSNSGILGDVDNDGRIGLNEVINALQVASGIRSAQSTSYVITWKGTWAANQTYQVYDAVQINGSSYICLQNHTSAVSNQPPYLIVWEPLALKGDTGAIGAQGPQGPSPFGLNDTNAYYLNGNVGIGTASPNEQLEITGNLKLPSTTATTGIIKIGSTPFIHTYGTTGNTFVGKDAGNFTLTGISDTYTGYNTFVGYLAGMSNTTGYWNTFIGGYSGPNNTTGYRNTFIGKGAGALNTAGHENVFIGHVDGNHNTEGSGNVAIGEYTFTYNTTGSQNVAIGRYALHSTQTGYDNTAVGWGAGFGENGQPDYPGYSFTGNTLVGRTAGYSLGIGSYNTLIGRSAGYNLTSGSYNIIIGSGIPSGTDAPASDTSNFMNIGNTIYGDLSSGNVGIGTTSPAYKLHVLGTAAGTSWTNLSSRNLKEDIQAISKTDQAKMLATLIDMDLKTYRYKGEYGGDGTTKLGFIAEEMPKEVLSTDGKGVDIYELLAFTIGAMKAQQDEIDNIKRLYKENEALKALVCQDHQDAEVCQ